MPASAQIHQPLYEVKADLFRGLAHPLRIRVLEILSEQVARSYDGDPTDGDAMGGEVGGVPVSDLLQQTGLEASHLSQHLSVLRRNNLVVGERRGSQVFYRLAYPQVADLLAVARVLLREILQTNQDRLTSSESLPAVGNSHRRDRTAR